MSDLQSSPARPAPMPPRPARPEILRLALWALAFAPLAMATACGNETAAKTAADVGASGLDGCVPAPVAPGAARARPLACADDLPHGRMAAARVGDLVLENSRVRFVVRKGKHGHAIGGLVGGNLVDAVALDGNGDQVGVDALREWVPSVGLHLVRPDVIEVVAAGDAGEARVRVSGPLTPFPTAHAAVAIPQPKVIVSHEYVLRPDSRRLEIRTIVTPEDGKTVAVMAADATFWGGSLGLYRPGSGDADSGISPAMTPQVLGFAPVDDDTAAKACAVAYEAAVSVIDAGGILAIVLPSEPIGAAGTTFTRWLAVGDDLADAMAIAHPGGSTLQLTGTVTGSWPGVEVELLDAEGGPLTRCRPDEQGEVDCKIPAAATHARSIWLGNGNGQTGGPGQSANPAGVPLQAKEGAATVALPAPVPSLLEVEVRDKADGAGLPFQLLAQPADAASGARTFVDADGDATFRLPAGKWQVWLHHGPEFSALQQSVTVNPDTPTKLSATLERVVDTTGWIAADMHVHAEHSADSSVANRQRMTDAVAVGLDYVVATDHDFVTDYQPWLVEAGLADRLTVASGVEVSTIKLGHHNVWPMTPAPDLAGNGAIDWYGKDATELQKTLRGGDKERVVQCNHPRGKQSYFVGIGLDPKTTDEALLAFDAMEVINGKRIDDTVEVLEDWFGLIARGLRITATSNSDTHSLSAGIGRSRTYIWLGEQDGKPRDVQGVFKGSEADSALKAGRAVASTGPFLTLELVGGGDKAGIGETLEAKGGDVEAVATVVAPEWMPLGSVEIYRSGLLVHEQAVGDTAVESGRRKAVVKFKAPLQAEGWWLAMHRPGGAPTPPLVGGPVWAITNPVFERQVP